MQTKYAHYKNSNTHTHQLYKFNFESNSTEAELTPKELSKKLAELGLPADTSPDDLRKYEERLSVEIQKPMGNVYLKDWVNRDIKDKNRAVTAILGLGALVTLPITGPVVGPYLEGGVKNTVGVLNEMSDRIMDKSQQPKFESPKNSTPTIPQK
jgi:hypothetical protein